MNPLETVGENNEQQPMSVFFEITWEDLERREQAEAEMVQAGRQAYEGRDTGNPSGNMESAYMDGVQRLGQAMEKGDLLEAKRIQRQMEKLAEAMENAYADHDVSVENALQQYAARDIKTSIRFRANSFSEAFPVSAVDDDPVAGGSTFRTGGRWDTNLGWQEGETRVFLGSNWKKSLHESTMEMVAEQHHEAPHTEVQTIAVTIQASPERTRELISGIDWNALAGLLEGWR